jgi:hypothetical protein
MIAVIFVFTLLIDHAGVQYLKTAADDEVLAGNAAGIIRG